MRSFFNRIFRRKSVQLNESLEDLMARGSFVEAAKIIDAAKHRINFSSIFKRFSKSFDEALADDKIPDSDKLGVFITFMRNGLIITPRMIPYIVANTQNPWHVFETLDLALRQGKKLENLIGEKGLGGTTLLELSTWNRNDRSMFFKIDLTTYLAQKGAVMTIEALNNILNETQQDRPAQKDPHWGRKDIRTEGWKLDQVEKVFGALIQKPEELTAILNACKKLIEEKFGEGSFQKLSTAASSPRIEKKSSKIEGEPSTNPKKTHIAGDGPNFSRSHSKDGDLIY